MITNCNRCGNYTIIVGDEVAGARTMVSKLRLDFKDPEKRATIVKQLEKIDQLRLEIELLTWDVASEIEASKPQLVAA